MPLTPPGREWMSSMMCILCLVIAYVAMFYKLREIIYRPLCMAGRRTSGGIDWYTRVHRNDPLGRGQRRTNHSIGPIVIPLRIPTQLIELPQTHVSILILIFILIITPYLRRLHTMRRALFLPPLGPAHIGLLSHPCAPLPQFLCMLQTPHYNLPCCQRIFHGIMPLLPTILDNNTQQILTKRLESPPALALPSHCLLRQHLGVDCLCVPDPQGG